MFLVKIMVIAAHPRLAESRANRALLSEWKKNGQVLVRDLYQEYPDYQIDVQREKELLLEFDRIVFQFPFYWYSCPPLLKKWFDDVLVYGWAFGPEGVHLEGKEFLVATTAGGTEKAYRSGGDNFYTISELLRPIERTLTKCNGTFLPAFVVYDANQATDEILAQEAKRYAEHVQMSLNVLSH